jgi:amino acid adenylation domain-containing protein
MSYLLTHLLRRSAERFPDKTAVWARERTLTYREMEEQSNQMARLLQARGIQRGDRVGIYFPKAVESLVAMQAVMKAGAIYVPLDPSAPAARIRLIIKDCGISALLTTPDRLAGLDPKEIPSVGFSVMLADKGAEDGPNRVKWSEALAFAGTAGPDCPSITTDLAYILYTSGSTGTPKGVMLSHLNALTFVNWCARKFRVTTADKLSNHAPHHFDLSVFDIYNTLEAGATLYMVPDEVHLFPASVAAFIDKRALSIWYSVPSALVMMLQRGNLKPGGLQGLRILLFAGEVFPMKYLRQLSAQLPHTELYNLYGPTETNVCTYYLVEPERLEKMERLPIGRACENTEVFAVTEDNRLAAQGEEGELYCRGTTVTNGYWGDAEKTKQGLVPNPFQAQFEEKAYRTGDIVKLSADEHYDFVGRRDSMIKSRGYRIELGEIEAALLSHPGIMEAVCLTVPDDEIGNRIRAVVALHESVDLTPIEVQQHCAQKVPSYMIPEMVEIRATVLPRTSTGKIDRQLLARESAAAAR